VVYVTARDGAGKNLSLFDSDSDLSERIDEDRVFKFQLIEERLEGCELTLDSFGLIAYGDYFYVLA
jgi:hypothetical protein